MICRAGLLVVIALGWPTSADAKPKAKASKAKATAKAPSPSGKNQAAGKSPPAGEASSASSDGSGSGDRGRGEQQGRSNKKGEKVFDFTGFELAGSVRMPQLLYFLDRAEQELERASLERRSFLPEMMKSIDEENI